MPYWPFAHREPSAAVAAVPPGSIVFIEETLRGSMQDLFAAQQALVGVRLDELSNKIALYRALGGGFQ